VQILHQTKNTFSRFYPNFCAIYTFMRLSWGYGVNLQYGGSAVADSTLNIIPANTSQWSARSGQITVTKTGVFSTPQRFYFRLNSVQSTIGTPGATENYDVDVSLASVITAVGDFNIEGDHWLNFAKYFDSAYMDLYLWAWKNGSAENTGIQISNVDWSGYRGNYQSGQHTKFDSRQRTDIYKLSMPDVTVGTKVNVRYILKTYTGAGGTYVGEDSAVVQGIVQGNMKIKNAESWKSSLPFVKSEGNWKPCCASIRDNGTWKDGEI
jgi:hypothetical protein